MTNKSELCPVEFTMLTSPLSILSLLLTAAINISAAESAAEPVAPKIPAGAVKFGGHHYLLVDNVEDLTWHSAKKQCEEWGGHLATIGSKEEAEFIAKLCDGAYMFLGATDEAEEDTWVWVDGTPWEYTNWMEGQPNDYGGTEDYLATYDDGEWVDVDSEGTSSWMPSGFICEWDQ